MGTLSGCGETKTDGFEALQLQGNVPASLEGLHADVLVIDKPTIILDAFSNANASHGNQPQEKHGKKKKLWMTDVSHEGTIIYTFVQLFFFFFFLYVFIQRNTTSHTQLTGPQENQTTSIPPDQNRKKEDEKGRRAKPKWREGRDAWETPKTSLLPISLLRKHPSSQEMASTPLKRIVAR